jgi:hypothetical protein
MSAIFVRYLGDLRQSSFLLDTVAKATLLLAAATLATALLRRSSAAVRHRVWCLTFAALVLLPGLSASLPEWRLAVLPKRGALAQSGPLALRSPPGSQAEGALITQTSLPLESDFVSQPVPLAEQAGYSAQADYRVTERAGAEPDPIALRPPGLAVLWLIGTLLTLSPLLVGLVRTLLLRRRSLPINDTNWTTLVDDLRQRLALSRHVGLYENACALMPMTWGVVRPVVLLPRHARDLDRPFAPYRPVARTGSRQTL